MFCNIINLKLLFLRECCKKLDLATTPMEQAGRRRNSEEQEPLLYQEFSFSETKGTLVDVQLAYQLKREENS